MVDDRVGSVGSVVVLRGLLGRVRGGCEVRAVLWLALFLLSPLQSLSMIMHKKRVSTKKGSGYEDVVLVFIYSYLIESLSCQVMLCKQASC